ncbi:MAG: tetratricopeptide repeat protein [Hyphomicrobiaceae bacterium]|nr:tetratricopeptide repeat protein [Hyphomicrobiaceae bacterium]
MRFTRLLVVAAMGALGLAEALLHPVTMSVRAERAAGASEESFAAVHDRAAAAYVAGEWDKALAGFSAALALNPNSALAHYNRGNVYYAKGDNAAAVVDFTEALRLNPKLPYAHMNRGNALSNLGRLDDALQDLNEAVRLQPALSDVYFNRAIVHVRRRDMEKALTDYELAIARDGHDHEAKAARQRLVTLLGRQNGDRASTDIDTSQIATEITHARHVEHFLRIASESCLAQGDNLESLKTLALMGKWKVATPDELARGSTATTRLDGGWTFADRFGTYALIRSISNAKPPVFVCSLTAQPLNAHMFDDMTEGFASRFDVSAVEPPLSGQSRPARRYRLTTPKGTLLVGLKFAPERNALTLRTYFGNP